MSQIETPPKAATKASDSDRLRSQPENPVPLPMLTPL